MAASEENGGSIPTSLYGEVPKEILAKAKEIAPGDFTLLHADFCPFALRSWLALLEKEVDPTDPQNFEEIHCCYFMGERDPGTEILYGLGLKTVPVMIVKGQIFTESTELSEFIDDMIPKPALKPSDPTMLFNMRAFLKKHGGISTAFYKVLMNQDKEQEEEKIKKLLDLLIEFNDDLGKFEGPYLCGDQFTLADISVFGFIERVFLVLPKMKGWSMPKELTNISTWYETCQTRPSVKIAQADRGKVSQETYCFEELERGAYLRECYECYANNEVQVGKDVQKADGKPAHNAYRAYKKNQKAEE